MRVAVTGASGLIGGNLVRLLLERGHEVRCLVRQDTRAIQGLPVEMIPGDILQQDTLVRLMDGVDWVFHLAARITLRQDDPTGRTQAINVQGTQNVISACKAAGVKRLIHFGSINCFNKARVSAVVDETAPMATDPDLPVYDRTKAQSLIMVQEAARAGALDAVAVCPTGVIGPFDFKPSAIGEMIRKIAQKRMPVAIEGSFDWVDARDVSLGALAAAETGRSGEAYILSGNWGSVRDIARMTADAAGVKPPLWYPPTRLVMPVGVLMDTWSRIRPSMEPVLTRMSLKTLSLGRHVSHDKATGELGYRPRELKQTVTDVVRWFQFGTLEEATD